MADIATVTGHKANGRTGFRYWELDAYYENWAALYACIFNKKLCVDQAIKIIQGKAR